jgi:hypothetical protein
MASEVLRWIGMRMEGVDKHLYIHWDIVISTGDPKSAANGQEVWKVTVTPVLGRCR